MSLYPDSRQNAEILAKATKAFAHPLRVQILTVLVNGPQSARTLARILGEPRNLIDYHLTKLDECEALETAGTRKGRSKPERFVRLASSTAFGLVPLEGLPKPLAVAPVAALIDSFRDIARRSAEAGQVERYAGSVLTGRPLTLDERGWNEASAALTKTDALLTGLEDQSRIRICHAGPATAISAIGGLALFRPIGAG